MVLQLREEENWSLQKGENYRKNTLRMQTYTDADETDVHEVTCNIYDHASVAVPKQLCSQGTNESALLILVIMIKFMCRAASTYRMAENLAYWPWSAEVQKVLRSCQWCIYQSSVACTLDVEIKIRLQLTFARNNTRTVIHKTVMVRIPMIRWERARPCMIGSNSHSLW